MKWILWSAAVLRRIISLLVIIRFFQRARYHIIFIDQGRRVQRRVAIFFPGDEIRIGSLWETPYGHLYAIVDNIPYAIDASKDRPEVLVLDGMVVAQGL